MSNSKQLTQKSTSDDAAQLSAAGGRDHSGANADPKAHRQAQAAAPADRPAPNLVTPIYLKTDQAMEWPTDRMFYLLSRSGLFLCRNHDFFSSCVPADRWPGELAEQRSFLNFDYPRLPQRMLERVVGFFDIIGERHHSEAGVLLTWNSRSKQLEFVVPQQTGTVGGAQYGKPYPMDLYYEVPPLPPHVLLIGDIHSHVDGPAYASWTDRADEAYRPGLHLVVGRILDEPPEFYCAVMADGTRFRVRDLSLVMEGYRQRRRDEVPGEWLDKVKVEAWSSRNSAYTLAPGKDRGTPGATTIPSYEEPVAVRRGGTAESPSTVGKPDGKPPAGSKP